MLTGSSADRPGLLNGISRHHSSGLKARFPCQSKINMQHIDPVRCEQLNSGTNQSGSISPSIVHTVSD